MNNTLIIIGASGHGKVIADVAKSMDKWSDIAFLDDDAKKCKCLGYNVVGNTKDADKYIDTADFFVAIGNNDIRKSMLEELITKGACIAALIHSDAVIGTNVEIGKGSAVMAGVVINCSSSIGIGCIINTSSSIDHDNVLGNYVHISPGVHLAGTVCVGDGSWLGIGAAVSNNVKVCSDCIIGAGTVVIDDIDKTGTYVGVPARRIN